MRSHLLLCLGLVACGSTKAEPPASAPSTTAPPSATPAAPAHTPPAPVAPEAPPATAAKPPPLRALQVATGEATACALMSNGTVRCWGREDFGELGTGLVATQAASPVEVPGLAGIEEIALAFDYDGGAACARGKGNVWCWGARNQVPLGDASGKPQRIADLAGATALAFGGGLGYALMPNGTVQWWGNGAGDMNGLSDEAAGAPSSVKGVRGAIAIDGSGCALLKDGSVTCADPEESSAARKVKGVSGASAIAGQGSRTCALLADATVTCWDRYDRKAHRVAGVDGVVALSVGASSCAVKQDGTLWCWSRDAAPAPVPGLSGVTQVSAGAGVTCAVADGEVSCWGANAHGQLGDGTLIDRTAPVPVMALGDATLAAATDGTAQVPDGTVVQSWDGAPSGCAHGALDLRYQGRTGSLEVMSSYAERTGDSLMIVKVASYHLDPKPGFDASDNEDPRGAQLVVDIQLTHDGAKPDDGLQPLDSGVYALDSAKHRNAEVRVLDRAGDHKVADIYAKGVQAGEVELTHLDDDWVCGTIRVKTADTTITGPFAARVAK
jgi:hypothetical protein